MSDIVINNTFGSLVKWQKQTNKMNYQEANTQIFDFMQGKDPKNEEDYNNQIMQLAQGEIALKDLDKDGSLSAEEVMLDYSGVGVMKDPLLYLLVDSVVGDKDTNLSTEELAQYYELLDKYDPNDENAEPDGKIDYKNIKLYNDFLVNQISDANYTKMFDAIFDKNRTEPAYDFMDGFDPNNTNSYFKQTVRLGRSTVEVYDKNKDGVITSDEYSKEDFDFNFETLDYGNKGYIDEYDFGTYWEYIDKHDEDGKNGKIYVSLDVNPEEHFQ